MNAPAQLLTTTEVCELLRVSDRTLRQLIAVTPEGERPWLGCGKLRRWQTGDVLLQWYGRAVTWATSARETRSGRSDGPIPMESSEAGPARPGELPRPSSERSRSVSRAVDGGPLAIVRPSPLFAR
jgi:excisionase family DNA binding protein